jgi:hypothetical protein
LKNGKKWKIEKNCFYILLDIIIKLLLYYDLVIFLSFDNMSKFERKEGSAWIDVDIDIDDEADVTATPIVETFVPQHITIVTIGGVRATSEQLKAWKGIITSTPQSTSDHDLAKAKFRELPGCENTMFKSEPFKLPSELNACKVTKPTVKHYKAKKGSEAVKPVVLPISTVEEQTSYDELCSKPQPHLHGLLTTVTGRKREIICMVLIKLRTEATERNKAARALVTAGSAGVDVASAKAAKALVTAGSAGVDAASAKAAKALVTAGSAGAAAGAAAAGAGAGGASAKAAKALVTSDSASLEPPQCICYRDRPNLFCKAENCEHTDTIIHDVRISYHKGLRLNLTKEQRDEVKKLAIDTINTRFQAIQEEEKTKFLAKARSNFA